VSRPVILLLSGLWLALLAAGCGGDDEEKGKGKGATTPAATTPAGATGPASSPAQPSGKTASGCDRVQAIAPKPKQKIAKPKLQLDPKKTYRADIGTTCGPFSITLDVDKSPKTTASFVHLARQGFYNGLGFHRIIPGFVIQGGDPEGNGQGGPGYSVTETPGRGQRYRRGTVAMAKAEQEAPGQSGSQFFVVTGEDAQLPPEYALLGRVSGGEAALDKIGVVQTDATDKPVDPVLIQQVRIVET